MPFSFLRYHAGWNGERSVVESVSLYWSIVCPHKRERVASFIPCRLAIFRADLPRGFERVMIMGEKFEIATREAR
jgi:hypothetical protein